MAKQLQSFFKFNTNKISLSHLPQFNHINSLETNEHFDQLEILIQNFHELSEGLALEFSYLSQDEVLTEFVENLSKKPYVNISELNNLCLILEIFTKLINYPPTHKIKSCPNIKNDELVILKNFIRQTRQLINYEEVLFLDKHPKLLRLNEELKKIDGQIHAKMQDLHQANKYKGLPKLDFEVIHDAYYLLIPSDHYVHAMGKVHGKSNSGKSLYIEPLELLEANSKRQIIVFEIKNIIEKIIHELISNITHIADDIKKIRRFIFHFDFLLGRAKFSQAHKTCRPSLNNERKTHFENMYLSTIQNALPNSVCLDNKARAILVSGPNTGGKSVFLKTFANNFILISHGFESCATKCSIDLTQNLYFFSHDFQDIEVKLSSFSAEVTNYLNALKDANAGSIFLFDEIFNSTSSEEASALSLSLFEYLLEQQFQFVATTHHSKLKYDFTKLNHTTSASFTLNTVTGTPTYQIAYGKPGTSQAFKIFENIEKNILSDSPISRILPNHTSTQEIAIENLLHEVRLKQDEVELQKTSLEKEKLAFQLIQNQLVEDIRKEKLKLNDDFKLHILEVETSLNKMVKEIEAKELTKKQALSELIRIEKKYVQNTPLNNNTIITSDFSYNDFFVGQQVRHNSSNLVGIISQIDKGKSKITFSAKGKTLTTKASELTPTNLKENVRHETIINLDLELPNSTLYDCRGHRAEQVERDLYRLIYHLANGDIPYLIIVHGHGEGILKNLIRDILKKNQDLEWKAEDGNDGSTRVEMKV